MDNDGNTEEEEEEEYIEYITESTQTDDYQSRPDTSLFQRRYSHDSHTTHSSCSEARLINTVLKDNSPSPLTTDGIPRPHKLSSPEHYTPPHKSPSPSPPNRFAAYQESVQQQTLASESADRKRIEEWESTKRCWFGTGQKHVESRELAFSIDGAGPPCPLGAGAYGTVDKVDYGGVAIVRKKIDRLNLRHPKSLDELREEAKFMERLKHRHIVTLIGTFTHDSNRFLNILTYPVGVCDLEQYLQDFEQLRGQEYANITSITDRVRRLGFADLKPAQYHDPHIRSELMTTMALRMMSMLGCLTDAMEYVHSSNISHQDLKPRNIVLSPLSVYITDFGISRVLRSPVHHDSHEASAAAGYSPPEIHSQSAIHHPSAVDVYSLGSIFLNVVALPPGFPRANCRAVLSSPSPSRAAAISGICTSIAALLVRSGGAPESEHSISQKHIMGLIQWMLVDEPDKRPDMGMVNRRLHVLGGLEQIYHAGCCKRSSAWMAWRLNEDIRMWEDGGERRWEGERERCRVGRREMERENEMLRGEVDRLRGVLEGVGEGDKKTEMEGRRNLEEEKSGG